MNANEGVCVRLNVIHTASNWAAKRCKTGAGSLPNQNNLEECQTLHVLRTHCMHGLVQWGEGGREGGGIHKAYINHGPAAREAVSLENC